MTVTAELMERIERAAIETAPFPHLQIHPGLPAEDFREFRSALPDASAFDLKGKGTKLELDLIESGKAFSALPQATQTCLIQLRGLFRDAVAPVLVRRFASHILEKYVWLLGPALAQEMLDGGLTTTNGRIMGRARGFWLDPHLDSAHTALTCLLYFSTLENADDGALCLYSPERSPEVLHASTYYPKKSEGISSVVAKTIPIRENLLVAFLNGPRSLHGFSRTTTDGGAAWRFAYQCHVVPTRFDVHALATRLAPEHLSRWSDYVR
jgi:hypothetical protein